jgi:hypothetical protein
LPRWLGAILACASWRLTPGRIVVRTLIALGAIALVAAGWGEMERRYSETSLEEEYLDTTVDGRGVYLRLSEAIVRDHFFGVGLNNWSYRVSRTYGPRLGYRFDDYDNLISVYGTRDDKAFRELVPRGARPQPWALTLGELGVPGSSSSRCSGCAGCPWGCRSFSCRRASRCVRWAWGYCSASAASLARASPSGSTGSRRSCLRSTSSSAPLASLAHTRSESLIAGCSNGVAPAEPAAFPGKVLASGGV